VRARHSITYFGEPEEYHDGDRGSKDDKYQVVLPPDISECRRCTASEDDRSEEQSRHRDTHPFGADGSWEYLADVDVGRGVD
jgi:hypothetical protein